MDFMSLMISILKECEKILEELQKYSEIKSIYLIFRKFIEFELL